MDGLTEDQIADLERRYKDKPKDITGECEGEAYDYHEEDLDELDFNS